MQGVMDVHTAGKVSFLYGRRQYEEKVKVCGPWRRRNPIINAMKDVPCHMEPCITSIEAHLLTLMFTTHYESKLIK